MRLPMCYLARLSWVVVCRKVFQCNSPIIWLLAIIQARMAVYATQKASSSATVSTSSSRLHRYFRFALGFPTPPFDYANLRLSAASIEPDGELTVAVDVMNTGAHAGHDVIQVYVRDDHARMTRPPEKLKGFAKVTLKPGQTNTVTLPIGMRVLAYFDSEQAAWIADAGLFETLIGSSTQNIRARASFSLTASWRQPVRGSEP